MNCNIETNSIMRHFAFCEIVLFASVQTLLSLMSLMYVQSE